jgi:AcrR family transcriptional regulator
MLADMTVPGDVAERVAASRRERKKQRTREALVDAAFTLFAEKGFEATTVEEIADAVDVSSRTFFRYFSSKEDVALTFQEEQFSALLDALAAQPAGLPVVTALGRAAVEVSQACEQGALGFDPERFVCLMDLVASSPALQAGSLEMSQQKHATLTATIAQWMGVDPASDLRPHLVAAAAPCAFRAAADAWRDGVLKTPTLTEAVAAAFALLEESLNYPAAPAGS